MSRYEFLFMYFLSTFSSIRFLLFKIFSAPDSDVVESRVVIIWMELLLMVFWVWDLETFRFQAPLQELD